MTENIRNRVVITGASSGLGEAAARLLAKEGAKLMLGAQIGGNINRFVIHGRSKERSDAAQALANPETLTAPRHLLQLGAMFVFAPTNTQRRRHCTVRSGMLSARRRRPAG